MSLGPETNSSYYKHMVASTHVYISYCSVALLLTPRCCYTLYLRSALYIIVLTDDSLRSGDVSGYGRSARVDPPVVSANTYKVEHQAASAANTKYNTQLPTGGVQGQGDVYMSCVLV